jgi:hypothetical protein
MNTGNGYALLRTDSRTRRSQSVRFSVLLASSRRFITSLVTSGSAVLCGPP